MDMTEFLGLLTILLVAITIVTVAVLVAIMLAG